ncbi:hypothetical protein AB0O91_38935 [Kitasatospora sp. NPDC089797]|uniref:hypothetical protein n=1 Tax=Kitasatospora sp. NPDC089797 TaxID=3155298 RepID=UPI0034433E53
MRLRKALTTTLATAAVVAGLLAPTAANAAPTSATRPTDAWRPCAAGSPTNQIFRGGTKIPSGERVCVAAYQLVMQYDGNLVIYNNTGQPLWNSQTEGFPGAYAIMQEDGNFVVYQGTQWLWNSRTGGNTGHYLYLCFQTDGNLVVYAPLPNMINCNSDRLWWSGT